MANVQNGNEVLWLPKFFLLQNVFGINILYSKLRDRGDGEL
jgi:hypothetical protein